MVGQALQGTSDGIAVVPGNRIRFPFEPVAELPHLLNLRFVQNPGDQQPSAGIEEKPVFFRERNLRQIVGIRFGIRHDKEFFGGYRFDSKSLNTPEVPFVIRHDKLAS